ncbi:hypothetical protein NAMH_1272 [Nautilia profundicola AmH]|uniref:HPt domain-containing protein n=1 Tax=Nautilia profundicola (strain ATCC BAA-1463 / DSM 18972 / AmH) TaxID=598659 RepID=B9L5M7_NAUPA|nr:hypothetical protein [Nautilia profundicola]ACM92934.1 hypothetical protein NAMH_1272 [Nautilia profundicola AmH]
MLIIVKDNQITGIEKKLLNTLNIDLSSVSEFINTLNLQLSSINNTPITINDKNFNVNEIELLSTENIKIFDLTLSEETAHPSEESLQPHDFGEAPLIKEHEEAISKEPEFAPKEEVSLAEPEINLISEEKSEDFLVIPQSEEEEPTLDIGIIQEEEPQIEEVEKEEKEPEEKLIAVEEEHIEFEEPTESELNEIELPEAGVIEISFEDDLEEIRKILSMNKEEFNKATIEELKKASEELGIDYKELVEWHDQLIDQFKDEKSAIYKYINKKDYNKLHESYHKLKGAALNLRLSKIALVLKKLDELSKSKEDIEKIKKITDDFYKLIENEAINLAEETKKEEEKEQTAAKPDKYIEDIILKTIQTYLSTQNEAQFQKDKKYIEKLLNTKINSIEDLQQIIKGM